MKMFSTLDKVRGEDRIQKEVITERHRDLTFCLIDCRTAVVRDLGRSEVSGFARLLRSTNELISPADRGDPAESV